MISFDVLFEGADPPHWQRLLQMLGTFLGGQEHRTLVMVCRGKDLLNAFHSGRGPLEPFPFEGRKDLPRIGEEQQADALNPVLHPDPRNARSRR